MYGVPGGNCRLNVLPPTQTAAGAWQLVDSQSNQQVAGGVLRATDTAGTYRMLLGDSEAYGTLATVSAAPTGVEAKIQFIRAQDDFELNRMSRSCGFIHPVKNDSTVVSYTCTDDASDALDIMGIKA